MVAHIKELYKNGRIQGKANYVFTPELAAAIGSIHGTLYKPNESVVIGRDYHNDSRMLKRGYTSGMMSAGVNLLNLQDCSYPLLQFTIRRFGAAGGVYFSGGHLFSEDIGVRFVDASGIEYSPDEVQRIVDMYDDYTSKVRRVDPNEVGHIVAIPQTEEIYTKSLETFVNKKNIEKANLKVVVDCSYSPTGKITPLLMTNVGVEIIALNTHFRQRSSNPVPNIHTLKNTADIVKASNSQLGVCFDVDGSRILVMDENGLEVSFEDLLMLFVSFDEKIQKLKGSTVITTPTIPPIVKKFITESGFTLKQVENLPGEISRQIREERACFAASDTLKYYFPQYAPFSDGNFILLKLLDIMTNQKDILSSLVKGFPKGAKVNKTIPATKEVIENFHNNLREKVEQRGYKYRDIINELKIVSNETYVTVKLALYRDAITLSSESEDVSKSKKMLEEIEKLILEIKP